jgi:hypothetical protein
MAATQQKMQSLWIDPKERNLILSLARWTRSEAAATPKLSLVEPDMKTIFHHDIPQLHHSTTTGAETHDDKQLSDRYKPFRIISMLSNDNGWICYRAIKTCDGTKCKTTNGQSLTECWSCGYPRPALSPEMIHLQCVSIMVKKEMKEAFRQCVALDHELWQNKQALLSAKDKLIELRRSKSSKQSSQTANNEAVTVDVSLVQSGVMQRIDADAAIPRIKENVTRLSSRLTDTRTKLTMMTYFLYELAIPHVQRFFRGWSIRICRDVFVKRKGQWIVNTAARRLQQSMRRLLAKTRVEGVWNAFKERMATKIQCEFRLRKARSARQLRMEEFHNQVAFQIQEFIRSINMVKKAKIKALDSKAERARGREEEVQQQRVCRAFIVQCWYRKIRAKELARRRKIELQLHGRLLSLLGKFKLHGNLFSLLNAINEDYLRYEKVIDDVLARESSMAETFVSKVRDFIYVLQFIIRLLSCKVCTLCYCKCRPSRQGERKTPRLGANTKR